MNPFYPSVAERARNRCEYCRAPEDAFSFAFEVDHITPQACGGLNVLDNFALACHACNLYKSDFETGRDEQTQTETLLFHPRRDVWTQHFQVTRESAEIVGLTSTGRATILRLQINHPRHVAVRRRWIEWQLFDTKP